MMVVSIRDAIGILSRDGPLPCHEDLREEGKLVLCDEATPPKCIFISHTWLGLAHPDPTGIKMRLLLDLLTALRDGNLAIKAYFVNWMNGGRDVPPSKLRREYADACIWFDYW